MNFKFLVNIFNKFVVVNDCCLLGFSGSRMFVRDGISSIFLGRVGGRRAEGEVGFGVVLVKVLIDFRGGFLELG